VLAEAEPGKQALLVLVYLRKGDKFAEPAAGFGVGSTTAWKIRERDGAGGAGAEATAGDPGREEERACLRGRG